MNFQTENAGNTKKNKSNNNRRRCPIKWDGKCDCQGWSDGVSKHIYEAHEVFTFRVHIYTGNRKLILLPNCDKSTKFCKKNNGQTIVISDGKVDKSR